MFTVFVIQGEGLPDKNRRCNNAKPDTEPLTDACHKKNDEEHKNGQQSAGKEEKVLAFQSFELHSFADAFVDWIICHDLKGKKSVKL